MEKVYVFGHQKPDTDSVTSAIAVAYLKNQLGIAAEARVLGNLNKETKFVLDHFKIEEPKYLDSVKLQIKDVDYYKGYSVSEHETVIDTYNYFVENKITGSPVVDKDNKIKGIVTLKDLTRKIIENTDDYIDTTYDKLMRLLDGEAILRFDEEIKGEILIASYQSSSIFENIKFKKDNILIVGGRHSVIEYAVNSDLGTIIIVGDNNIKEEHIKIAKEKNINIIRTKLNSIKTAKKIELSDSIYDLILYKNFSKFNEQCNFYEFVKEAGKLGHNNYPVVDSEDNCLGLIRVTENNKKHPKKVILVDHNESSQSVDGLNEASIIEVVDHHRIGDVSTSDPINFRNMAVGSTNTIVYQMFKEQNVEIPYNIAGVMLSGILSDTLSLTSSTTTPLDKVTVKELSKLMNLDYEEYYKEMLKAGTSVEGLTIEEILTQDLKFFQTGDKKYAVAQTITLDIDNIMSKKDEFLKLMTEKKTNNDLETFVFIITDVLKNGSYLLFTDGSEEMLESSFGIEAIQGVFVANMTSRKKQVVPYINEYLK